MTIPEILLVCLIVAIASFGQSVTGFGFSLLAVAPLGLVIDPKDAVAVSMIYLVVVSGLVAVLDREHLEWRAARPLLAGAAPGLPLGIVALTVMSASVLRFALAASIVYAIVSLLRGFSLSTTSRGVERIAGFATGFLTTSINANGPPTVLVLQARRLEPRAFRPTTSAVLGSASMVGVVLFAVAGRITGDVLMATAWSSPGLIIGWTGGNALARRVEPEAFRRVVLGLLILAAIATTIAAFTDV